MARPKNNPDYNPEKARDELIQAVVELYENPPEAEQADKDGHTKMKYLQQEFGLSMTKIRKLLVTGGVYEFLKDDIELVSEIAEMRETGLTDEQIREELSISVGTLSSLTPYRSGTYNADFTADGYDYSNVSTDARRKRSQRKREKMKEKDVLEERQKSIEEMKDHRTAMDRRKESEKSNLNQAREDTLEQELNDLLFAMTEKHEGKFLRAEDVAAFDVLFGKIVDKLKVYFGGNPREYGKVAGERLIKLLKSVGTNDDIFPEYEIQMVRDAGTGDWEK